MRAARIAAAAALLAAAAPAGPDTAPAGYAARFRLAPAARGGVQRVALPAAVLVAVRDPRLRDVRVFDARGRTLPVARATAAVPARRDALAISPILGAADAPAGARVSVRLDREGRPTVAEVGGGTSAGGGAATLGALLDTRGVRADAAALLIEADLPAGQPVRVEVAASRDLDDWRPLGHRSLYRAPGAPTTAARIALDAPLDRDWLRVTWRTDTRLLAPVAVRRATLVSRGGTGAEATVEARLARLADPHAAEAVIPFGAPLASVRVDAAAGDAPLPVRLLGRGDREHPWTPLGRGVTGAPIALGTALPLTLRIEADARTAGFSAAPTLRFAFAPAGIAFAPSAAAPFTLAVGRAGATDPFLPLATLAGGGNADLPEAVVTAAAPAPLRLAAPDDAGSRGRAALLWGLLLGATAMLGGLAWLLWRRGPPADDHVAAG